MRNSSGNALNGARLACLLACVAAGGTAAAAESSTAENLTRIEAETAVLKARAKKIEVQAEIASKQAEIAKLTMPASAGDPTVRAVEGVGGRNYATVQMANGSALDVRVGDVLPNGMTVEAVGANEVIVRKADKRRYRLGATPVSPPPGTAHGFAGLPLPPPAATLLPPPPRVLR